MQNVVKSVTEVTFGLCDIAEEGYSIKDLTKIWAMLPIEDDGISNLESIGECIIQVSDIVDKQFPALSSDLKTAKKYRLMARLLTLKAEQVEKIFLTT